MKLCNVLNIPKFKRPPCYNVFRNAFHKTELGYFEDLFNSYFNDKACDLVHFDGKASSGTIKNAQDAKQSFLMTVSAFCSKEQRTILRRSFDNKKDSEVKVVRALIKQLEGKKTVTADSVHCNKETIKLLEKHKYLVQFKGNQKNLKKKATEMMEEKKGISEHFSEELNRGRTEERLTKVYRFSSPVWKGAKAIVIQERWRNKKYERAFYLSSELFSAKKAARLIRGHWRIESMHWERDELMGEDSNMTKDHSLAGMLSCLRTISLNIAKGTGEESFTEFKEAYCHDIDKLISFF